MAEKESEFIKLTKSKKDFFQKINYPWLLIFFCGISYYYTFQKLFIFAIILVIASWKLFTQSLAIEVKRKPKTASKKFPGRLIIFEGLDGSGKTTQAARLNNKLADFGCDVVYSSWNSFHPRKYSRENYNRSLSPMELSKLQMQGFYSQLKTVIQPALERGAIVLCDRYFFTGVVRDSIRINQDINKSISQYEDYIDPDLVFFFDCKPEITVPRVIQRNSRFLSSTAQATDGYDSDMDRQESGSTVKFYEAGLDLKLDEDPIQNFTKFQTSQYSQYQFLLKKFSNLFHIISANENLQNVEQQVHEIVLPFLNPLESYMDSKMTQLKITFYILLFFPIILPCILFMPTQIHKLNSL